MRLFRALLHRPFALLWTGQIISRVGDTLHHIALTWFLVETTGSAAAISTLFIALFLPNIIFLLIGGVAVDRFPRIQVMLVSDLLRGALVGVIAALAYAGELEVWHLYGMAIVFGFVDAFFQPAYTAAVPDLTPSDLLPSANSLTALSGRATSVVGPAVGALLVKIGGTSFAFAIDALSFVLSALCLLPLSRLLPRRARTGESPTVLAEVRAGISTVLGSPWLWVTIAIFSLVNVTQSGPLAIALPLLIKETLRADVDALGLFSSMSALGSVLMALWLGRAAKLRHRGLLAYGATIIGGLMTSVIGLPVGLPGIVAAAFVIGATITLFTLIWVNTLQEFVPRELLGRVSSVDQLGSFALLPIGYAATGWATEVLGPAMVFVIGGSCTAISIGLGLLHPAVRQLD
ncbi:MAG: MFS transporter [Chloroflexota bacterium]|nr:MFS transporter [Chloroflexota bacterium]